MPNLNNDLPRVQIGEGFQVRWKDIEMLQTLMSREILEKGIAHYFGGAYGATRQDATSEA